MKRYQRRKYRYRNRNVFEVEWGFKANQPPVPFAFEKVAKALGIVPEQLVVREINFDAAPILLL